jgi:hypothetical protein
MLDNFDGLQAVDGGNVAFSRPARETASERPISVAVDGCG